MKRILKSVIMWQMRFIITNNISHRCFKREQFRFLLPTNIFIIQQDCWKITFESCHRLLVLKSQRLMGWAYFNGLAKDCSIYNVLEMELLQSCAKPSFCEFMIHMFCMKTWYFGLWVMPDLLIWWAEWHNSKKKYDQLNPKLQFLNRKCTGVTAIL